MGFSLELEPFSQSHSVESEEQEKRNIALEISAVKIKVVLFILRKIVKYFVNQGLTAPLNSLSYPPAESLLGGTYCGKSCFCARA